MVETRGLRAFVGPYACGLLPHGDGYPRYARDGGLIVENANKGVRLLYLRAPATGR